MQNKLWIIHGFKKLKKVMNQLILTDLIQLMLFSLRTKNKTLKITIYVVWRNLRKRDSINERKLLIKTNHSIQIQQLCNKKINFINLSATHQANNLKESKLHSNHSQNIRCSLKCSVHLLKVISYSLNIIQIPRKTSFRREKQPRKEFNKKRKLTICFKKVLVILAVKMVASLISLKLLI